MKFGFYILLGTMIFSFIVGIVVTLISKYTATTGKDPTKPVNQPLLKDPSISNAITISQTTSNQNGPVRPEGESYSDGLIFEINIKRASTSPENLLIDIRNQLSKLTEDSNGQ